jgi:hypothetical protein
MIHCHKLMTANCWLCGREIWVHSLGRWFHRQMLIGWKLFVFKQIDKVNVGSHTYSEQEIRSWPNNGNQWTRLCILSSMLRNCMTWTFWNKGSPIAGRYFIPKYVINHLSMPFLSQPWFSTLLRSQNWTLSLPLQQHPSHINLTDEWRRSNYPISAKYEPLLRSALLIHPVHYELRVHHVCLICVC